MRAAGPEVVRLRGPLNFQTQVITRAAAHLESLKTPEHTLSATALVLAFIRPGHRCCDWAQVVGPCVGWAPDSSGGFCRNCGHHKSCPHTIEQQRAAREKAMEEAAKQKGANNPPDQPTEQAAPEVAE